MGIKGKQKTKKIIEKKKKRKEKGKRKNKFFMDK